MLFNCHSGAHPKQFSFRVQVEADTIDLAIIKFAKLEKFSPTHIRVRPQCRIAFRVGQKWFLFVYQHGLEPEAIYKKIGQLR